ncbi:low molecular weight phosphotyrosine protein phosphatase [Vibrio hepatarius]|uniref:arsenate reductase/protein-tyrosine-phosphatase family protein n=1 Tax=Vibrio hepatarius TaxID=171383 RepID=UPI001C09F41C|nr:low molecular weight phosphotyrosine protein phosphatase [Vibrio hepatarius]MBU2896902.1 low molecular weight phosphotyrosine protein phosphatase [Vibrio hepatarius]
MFNNILVVCVGNICRSPIGEAALQKLLPGANVSSAGLAAEKSQLVGKPADDKAILVAAENDIDLSSHHSQQVSSSLCAEFDLILVMEKRHIEAITSIAPEVRGKTMLFGQWIGQKDVPDPYKQSKEAFDYAYHLIEQAAQAWAKKL